MTPLARSVSEHEKEKDSGEHITDLERGERAKRAPECDSLSS